MRINIISRKIKSKFLNAQQNKNEDASKYSKRLEILYEQAAGAAQFPMGIDLLDKDILPDLGLDLDTFFAKTNDPDILALKQQAEERYKEEVLLIILLKSASNKEPFQTCVDQMIYGKSQWPTNSAESLRILAVKESDKSKKGKKSIEQSNQDKENDENKQVNMVIKPVEEEEDTLDPQDDETETESTERTNNECEDLQQKETVNITTEQAVSYYMQSKSSNTVGNLFNFI